MTIRTIIAVLGLASMALSWSSLSVHLASAQSNEGREVASFRKSLSHPSWINEKTLLATVSGFAFGNREIALIDLPSGEITVLAGGGCASASPDRTRVAWIPGPSSRSDVWLLDLRSRERRRLTNGLGAGCVVWSPDGARLAVLNTAQMSRNADDILILNADTGRVEEIIAAGDLRLNFPAWTPDGQRLVFAAYAIQVIFIGPRASDIDVRYPVNRVDVFMLRDRRRAELIRVTGDTAADLAFSPNGRLLALVIDRQIHLFDGTALRLLTAGHNPVWYPDGKSILFTRGYDCTQGVCAGDALYLMRLP